MKFKIHFNKTAFDLAIEMEYIEIVNLLLSCDKVDINIPYILNKIFFIQFYNKSFNLIQNYNIEQHSNSNSLMASIANFPNKIKY